MTPDEQAELLIRIDERTASTGQKVTQLQARASDQDKQLAAVAEIVTEALHEMRAEHARTTTALEFERQERKAADQRLHDRVDPLETAVTALELIEQGRKDERAHQRGMRDGRAQIGMWVRQWWPVVVVGAGAIGIDRLVEVLVQ